MEVKKGQMVKTDDSKIGQVKQIQNGIITIQLKDGSSSVIYRYPNQIVEIIKL
jgi:hypothetical protein